MEMKFESFDQVVGITPSGDNFDEFFYSNLEEMNIDDQMDAFLGIKTPEQFWNQSQVYSEVTLMKRESDESISEKTIEKTNYDSEQQHYLQSHEQSENNSNKGGNNHHNFQKHTVTALRTLITTELLKQMGENSEVLGALWNDFLLIKGKKIMTKKFLYTLFSSEKSSLENLKTYGFENLFKMFSEDEIAQSKKELRSIAYQIFNEKNIRIHVEGRNLQRKEEFMRYLFQYRQNQLGTGAVKKRMSKCSTKSRQQA